MIDEDKLKSKIEGLKSNLIHGACSSQIAMETRCKEEAYNEVLTVLDSMQEEPVSEFLNTESMIESYKQRLISQANGMKSSPFIDMCLASYKHGINETLDTLNLSNAERTVKNWKEPVSEELEQAAVEAFKKIVDDGRNSFLEIFKAGARWQCKQMMKDAVDGLVYAQLTISGEIMIRSNYFKSETLDYLDEVKLIIIKEDKV